MPPFFFLVLINSNLCLGWTCVHLKWSRYSGSRHLTILLLQPVNIIDDEAPWGSRRKLSATASRHWLIAGERKPHRRDRAQHERDDKNIITTATASKLFPSNYAHQLGTALVSHSKIGLIPASQGHKEKGLIEKQFMFVWLLQESHFSVWMIIMNSRQ